MNSYILLVPEEPKYSVTSLKKKKKILGYISFLVNFVHFLSFSCPSVCSDKHGQERFLYQGECWESCPAGYYPAEGHTCLPCPDNCELCHNAHICVRCTGGYFLVPTNHTCQKLACGQGKSALSHCLAPGCSMRSYPLDVPEICTVFQVLMLAPGMTLCDYMCSGDSDDCSSLSLRTPFSGFPKTHSRDTGMQLITEKLILN